MFYFFEFYKKTMLFKYRGSLINLIHSAFGLKGESCGIPDIDNTII